MKKSTIKTIFFKTFLLLIILGTTISMQAQNQKKVKIETPYGNMIVELYDQTPKHRDNFIKLIKEDFYNGTLFHRVINGFMIQGGDPESKQAQPHTMLGSGDVGYTIPAEFNVSKYHKKGALAAARQGDNVNPQKASSGCQFYIVQGDIYPLETLLMFERQYGISLSEEQKKAYSTVGGTPHLDGQYTVFGEVIEGLDVIDKIADVRTNSSDRPIEDIDMTITIVE